MVAFILLILSPMIIVPQKEVLYTAIESAGKAIIKVEEQKQFAQMYDKVIEELTTKYGDGDFEIANVEENDGYFAKLCVKTSYIKEEFKIRANVSGRILEDNFLEVYAKEKWGAENLKDFAIEKTIELQKVKIPEGYGIKFNFKNSYFDEFYEYEKGREPIVEDLIEMVEIRVDNEVLVGNSYTKNDLEKFSKNISDVCKIYIENYARDEWDDAVWFEFENGINPFCKPEEDKLGAYADSGYIKDAGSVYLLYLNPSPYKLDK